MTIAEKIKQLRKQNGLTQTELGERLGVKKNAVSKWECGRVEDIPASKIKAMAGIFGVTPSYLIDDDATSPTPTNSKPIPPGFQPLPEMATVPLIGEIACGTPVLAEENIKSYIGNPAAWKADFALECHGDSMAPKICDGDIVCIRQQPTVEQGQIAAVRIGDEATLKHYYQRGDEVRLVPENPLYSTMIYTGFQLEEMEIEGLAVGFCRGLVETRL